jgi:hypothetical protein
MKKLFYTGLCFLCIQFTSEAQTTVNFSYDNGGNMTLRNISITAPSPSSKFVNPFSSVKETNDSSNVIPFKIYPTPAKDFVNIEGELPANTESAQIFLFNSTGQLVKKDSYSGSLKTLNVGDLKSGLYYLEVNYSRNQSSNYKIIITN